MNIFERASQRGRISRTCRGAFDLTHFFLTHRYDDTRYQAGHHMAVSSRCPVHGVASAPIRKRRCCASFESKFHRYRGIWPHTSGSHGSQIHETPSIADAPLQAHPAGGQRQIWMSGIYSRPLRTRSYAQHARQAYGRDIKLPVPFLPDVCHPT
jgi:hypothetical protein